ncbi:immunoglobulin-like domain-containing protein [Listeria sp. ILCC797]|uniref:immunoglobulin-like domain-containing protein n=1 Tax=Listeria sp. ILCC797 TaxID=1918333 RepID=UPI00135642AE|nr:immunoglobulin-like domain-containing protein [Listeria sp. ILCC797]
MKKGIILSVVSILFVGQLATTILPVSASANEGEAQTNLNAANGITVNTFTELKSALLDNEITDITLGADITLSSTLYPRGTNKTIHGNGFTINANLKQIKLVSSGAVAKMDNIKIINTDVYGLFWSDANDVKVTYKDVEHTGRQLVYLPSGELILDGQVSSMSTSEEVYQGNKMTVLPGATVDFESTTINRSLAPVTLMKTDSQLIVGEGAHLNIKSAAANIWGTTNTKLINNGHMDLTSDRYQNIHLSTYSTMQFNNGSTLKANSGDTVEEALEATSGSIFVQSGATFEVTSKGTQGTIITGDQLVFEDGSNFSITNNNDRGAVFGTYSRSSDVTLESQEGIQVWNRGALTSEPINYAGPLVATFNLNGYSSSVSQSKLVSNNINFKDDFKTSSTGKITGGSFAKVELIETTINSLTEESTTVTGTGEPNSLIEIKANNSVLGSGTIDSEGNYSVTIPAQEADTEVTAQATFNALTSNVASTTVQAITRSGTITPNAFTIGDEAITGEFTGDVTSARLYVNDTSTNGGDFKADGTFEFPVSTESIKVGDTVEIVALDKNGEELDRKNVEIISNLSGTLSPAAYLNGNSNITGEFTGDINYAQLLVNDVHVSFGGTFSADGTFSYYVAPGTIKLGDTVTLRGIHRNDSGEREVLDTKQVEVIPQGSLTTEPYSLGTSNIGGSFTGDINFARLLVNGIPVSWGGTFNTDGTFSFYVNPTQIKLGDVITIEGFYRTASGETEILDTKQVEIAALEGTLTPDEYSLGTSNITGEFTGDINFAQLLVNGESVGWGGTFNADGTFNFYVKSNRITSEDTVTLRGFYRDSAGNTELIDTKQVEIAAIAGTLLPDAYTIGASNITGQFTGDINFARLLINGESIAWGGTFNENGTFNFYVNPTQIKLGDIVTMEGYNRTTTGATEILDTKQVEIVTLEGTLSPDVYEIGTTNITGQFTGDINFAQLLINGESIAWGGTFNEDGTFSFYVNPTQIKLGDIVIIEGFNRATSGDTEILATEQIEISALEGTLLPDIYALGTSNITGQFTGDINFAQLLINGESVAWGGVFNPDGTFAFYVNPTQITLGDVVTIKGFNLAVSGETELLDTKQVEIATLEGTITPSDYTLGSSEITGEYTGDINFARLVVNGTPTNRWGGVFNPDGTFSFFISPNYIKSGDEVEIQAMYRTTTRETKILDTKVVTLVNP